MELKKIFDIAIQKGIESDPRTKKQIDTKLKEAKESFKECKTEFEKDCFDKNSLSNPYEDSRILYGKDNAEIKKIAFGVDIETPELLLINELNKQGAKIDLVIAHHPEDRALLGLGTVMDLQVDVYANEGVPVNIAEKLMGPRITEINEAVHSINYNRATRAAELLNINFAGLHTPCDNCAYSFLTKEFEGKTDMKLKDIIKHLQTIYEFKEASKMGNPPVIVCGSDKNRAGKIVVTEFTGGTSGSKKMYEKIANAGVGTVLAMHVGKEHKEEAEKHGINVINCGHMASDSLGINLVLDEFEKKGIEIVALSGVIRYSRISE